VLTTSQSSIAGIDCAGTAIVTPRVICDKNTAACSITHIDCTRNTVVTVRDFFIHCSVTIVVDTIASLRPRRIYQRISIIAVAWKRETVLIRIVAERLLADISSHLGRNRDCTDNAVCHSRLANGDVIRSRRDSFDREVAPTIRLRIQSSS
jgi:hypothetical protein